MKKNLRPLGLLCLLAVIALIPWNLYEWPTLSFNVPTNQWSYLGYRLNRQPIPGTITLYNGVKEEIYNYYTGKVISTRNYDHFVDYEFLHQQYDQLFNWLSPIDTWAKLTPNILRVLESPTFRHRVF